MDYSLSCLCVCVCVGGGGGGGIRLVAIGTVLVPMYMPEIQSRFDQKLWFATCITTMAIMKTIAFWNHLKFPGIKLAKRLICAESQSRAHSSVSLFGDKTMSSETN